MANKTSIIVIAWDTIKLQRMITSACLGNITKFTDRGDYELVFVDQQQDRDMGGIDERHHNIIVDKYVRTLDNIGCSAAFNLGYKNSNPECENICFVHSDVFVPDNWLPRLTKYLDGRKVVFPTQGKMTREQVVESYSKPNLRAWDDAGVTLITKKQFVEAGGWDERFKAIYPEGIFRMRIGNDVICPSDVIITHIGGIGYYHDGNFEREKYKDETELYNSVRDEMTNGIKQQNYL